MTSALHALRAPPLDFTGRKHELAELLGRMREGGVTISALQGQGGIGKTALALKLAEELKPRYPDAQIDIDLRGASAAPRSPAAVMAHVIHAFEPTESLPEGEADLGGIYRSVLYGKRAILLFDNARDRRQVEPLVPPAGPVMIVTSRQSFHLPGLYAQNLDELDPADAIALVLKNAPRLWRGDAAEIAGICGRLPLALCLASSALAEQIDLEPAEYIEKLKTAKERIGLVEASLSLSFTFLDESLQAFWACLGVFPGDFDPEAAAAVGEIEPELARQRLRDLRKQSMVDYDREAKRYRLHDLSRVYAVSRLSGEACYGASLRHATYYKGVAAVTNEEYETGGDSITTGLARGEREWTNIEAGRAWAEAHSATDKAACGLCSDYAEAGRHYLALRHHPRDRIRWFEAALAAARSLDRHGAESAHLGGLGAAYADLGEPQRAIELFEQQLTIAREISDHKNEGRALGSLGAARACLGDARRALELFEQCLILARENGYRRIEGRALGDKGLAYAALGELRQAIELFGQQLTITRTISYRRSESAALGHMGRAYAALGELPRAIELFEQQLTISRELGDRRGEANGSWNLGEVYETLGEIEKAVSFMQVSIDFESAIGHPDAKRRSAHVDELRARLKR